MSELKAGNTVETLTPKQVAHVDTPKVDAPKAQETPKAAAPKENPPSKAEVEKPVTRAELKQLADAIQEIADRLNKHNTRAPFKI